MTQPTRTGKWNLLSIFLPLLLLAGGAFGVTRWNAYQAEASLATASLDELLNRSKTETTNPHLYHRLARRAQEAGNIAVREDAYAHAIALDPENEALYLEWSSVQAENRQAVALLRYYLQKHPDSAAAHLQLAERYQAVEWNNDAYSEAITAATKDPKNEAAWRLAGEAALLGRRLSEAEAALRQAIALKPEEGHTYLLLGYALMDHLQYPEAISAFQEAIRKSPQEATAYLALGTAQFKKAKTPEELKTAQTTLMEAIKRTPSLANAHLFLGRIQVRLQQWAEARHSLESAVTLDPTDADAHYEFARVLQRLGDSAGSARETALHASLWKYQNEKLALRYQFGKTHTPEDGLKLARLLAAHQEWDNARTVYNRILSLTPDMDTARQELAALPYPTR